VSLKSARPAIPIRVSEQPVGFELASLSYVALASYGLALEVMDHPVPAILTGEDFDAFELLCHVTPSF
jgi:hypothetical protein